MAKRLLFVMVLGLLTFSASSRAQELEINRRAPDFHARTFDGRDVRLADYKGQVLIINFWATWCGPCKKEMPLLNTFYGMATEHNYGLKILAITTEDSLPIDQLKPLADKVSFDMARNFHGPYGVLKGVPTNYIIDRNGILRYARAAAFEADDLKELLIPLLRQPTPDDSVSGPTNALFRLN